MYSAQARLGLKILGNDETENLLLADRCNLDTFLVDARTPVFSFRDGNGISLGCLSNGFRFTDAVQRPPPWANARAGILHLSRYPWDGE